MAESVDYHGGLVAFEGPGDLVSTQLRLLPTSSQIAILPSVKEFLEPEDPDQPFETRKFIKRVHNAVAKRRETALAFLKESTPRRKRLVFMNGGTPSAQTVCIRAISRNEAGGDISKAEAIFNEIVKGGVAGLDEHPATSRGSFLDTEEDIMEDPITKAMREADELDRETANLQPPSEIDLTVPSGRPRSMSLPMYSYADTFGDAAPFYVFGEQSTEDNPDNVEEPIKMVAASAPKLAITNFDDLEKFAALDFNFEIKPTPTPPAPPRSPSCIGETYAADDMFPAVSPNPSGMLDVASPRSDVFSIRSTEPIIIEQASLVRMKSSASAMSLARSQSVDRIHRSNSRYRDTLMRLKDQEKAATKKDRRTSVMELVEDVERVRKTKPRPVGAPKTVYVKPARLNKSLPPPPRSPAPDPKDLKATYVDRGTDAGDFSSKETPFQPVLPFSEDLVIHFKDESPDPILEYMIRAFREGVYPIGLPSSTASVTEVAPSIPHTPTWKVEDSPVPSVAQIVPPIAEHADEEIDEYDPFSYKDPAYLSKQLHPVSRTMTTSTLPTPAHTPPPTVSEPEDKFHEFTTVHCQTAVAMQNSLRSVLNIYFPPKSRGFSQFKFPLLPEMEGLWKPIFRDIEPGGSPRKDNHRVDQILAIGSQKGVKKTFMSSITSQLEQLGTKSSGISRTGRLDFRYLIATAMQSFTAQPLANQTHDNPFNNSYLLATLIVPHLETYFAAHSECRFLLLDYPPDHLATVLALQKLVGVDLMKVAQVIDTEAKEPLPFNHVRGGSVGHTSTKSGVASSSGSLQSKTSTAAASASSPDSVAVSKANFLLTSKATETEIATFVSTILNILVTVSRFYIPECGMGAARGSGGSARGKRTSGTFAPFAHQSQSPISPPMSPPSLGSRRTGNRSVSIKTSGRPSSVAETIKSRGIKVRRGEKKTAGDGSSVLTVDMDYESDLDLEERRLMPMFLKKTQARNKGNSRKALKFLGLA
ncbi:hypothetical protein C8034_v007883 [Colletotrichum sidae]|uniref:Gastric mucin-like protein n=1 Tax=Colletotrichum sidae TaxID=1347389 RepID=A0A4R8TP18_9PEZI|nr:hypothetical protein C8034_v007883 [Colletotrichum sidae]